MLTLIARMVDFGVVLREALRRVELVQAQVSVLTLSGQLSPAGCYTRASVVSPCTMPQVLEEKAFVSHNLKNPLHFQ